MMRALLDARLVAVALTLLVVVPRWASAEDAQGGWETACETCHAALEEDDEDLYGPMADWRSDVHYSKGITCADCHGGDPDLALAEDDEASMDPDKGFVGSPGRTEMADFCARCHSDIDYMRQFNPRPRVDQAAEYRLSRHGVLNLGGDTKTATCVDCHGIHGMLAVSHPASPVYPTNVPRTCRSCHSNKVLMANYGIGTDQYDDYARSVHGEALLERGDTGAPACNDCHGNHGALPPGVGAIRNVCGTCHVRESVLVQASFKKEIFEDLDVSECVVCHGNHDIAFPTDEMLSNEVGSVCMQCHEPGDQCDRETEQIYGALTDLSRKMAAADSAISRAEKLGMEVSESRFRYVSEGISGLVGARSLVHSFDTERILEEAGKALETADEIHQEGIGALAEVKVRRNGLLAIAFFALVALVGLVLKMRQLDAPRRPAGT